MALTRPDVLTDWPEAMFRLPERWRRMFDLSEHFMRMEEFVEGNTLVVRAELPGIDPKDIDVSIHDGMLHVTAQRHEEHKEKGSYRSEFSYGSFSRTTALPLEATAEVKATYTDGILEVRVPLVEAKPAQVQKIPITRT